jgi:hypothetical protein
MKTQGLVDVLMNESTRPDRNSELNDRQKVKKSSNAVASGAGSKGLFLCKSTKQKSAECKISQSLWDVDNGAGSKGLFCAKNDWLSGSQCFF